MLTDYMAIYFNKLFEKIEDGCLSPLQKCQLWESKHRAQYLFDDEFW